MKQRHIFGDVFALESIVAAGVFVVVLLLLAYALIRRRAGRRQVTPSERAERTRLEAYYVGVLAAFAAFLVSWTAWQNHREHQVAERPPVRVDVTSFQWCWAFDYPQAPERRTV